MTERFLATGTSSESGGFSLVELLIVIAILAILAAIAVPRFTSYSLKAYKSELDSDAKNVYTAAQNYLNDYASETIDSIDKLKTGGYRRSPNITFDSGSLTADSGQIEIHSTVLKARGRDNNAVIHYDGTIDFSNAP